jgi:hypothetical protein
MSGTWPIPAEQYFWSLYILTPKEHNDWEDILAYKSSTQYGT